MHLRLAFLALLVCAVGDGQGNRAMRSGPMTEPNWRYTPPDCVATGQAPPSPADASPEDFVELERSPCFSECAAYRVRLYRNGVTDWQFGPRIFGEGNESAARPMVSAADAETLLNKASDPSFWSACESYPAAEDSASYDLRLSIGGLLKTIHTAYGNGQEWLDEFSSDLDRLVETQRWLYADRAMGELGRMMIEYVTANGVASPLMRAAATGNLPEMAALLADGAPVDQQDANGRTALTYAAGAFQPRAVVALINTGADPGLTDLHGHTILMAAAHGGGFEEILATGQDINFQSREGLTALMVLAERANSEKIRLALANGADSTLTTANGRTAWDYLLHSYCGPVLDARRLSRLPGASAEGRQRCMELDRLLKPPVR